MERAARSRVLWCTRPASPRAGCFSAARADPRYPSFASGCSRSCTARSVPADLAKKPWTGASTGYPVQHAPNVHSQHTSRLLAQQRSFTLLSKSVKSQRLNRTLPQFGSLDHASFFLTVILCVRDHALASTQHIFPPHALSWAELKLRIFRKLSVQPNKVLKSLRIAFSYFSDLLRIRLDDRNCHPANSFV